jgi:ATP-dependent DNA ligase
VELPNREIFWVKPKYVVEVKYLEITKNLQLRNPTFLRFREDKRIEECVL